MVNPGDVEGLAKKIEMVINDFELAMQMGIKGKEKVTEMFNNERNVRILLNEWQRILDSSDL